MFENLSEKLQRAFKTLRGQAVLNEENIQEALREIRLALLEADVNFKVVKQLIDHIQEKAVGQQVATALSPGEQETEEHTSELQSRGHLVCRLLLEKKKTIHIEKTFYILRQEHTKII